MKSALLVLAIATMTTMAFAQEKAVPVEKEPDHHLALQNEFTRAFEVEVPPRATTLLHHHAHDYVFVCLGPAEIQNAVEGKPVTDLKLRDGEVEFARGDFSHRAINKLDTPFRNVTIEILKPPKPGTATDSERALEIGAGGLADPVIDNSDVRVYDVQLAAGGMLHERQYPHPMLLVAVSDLSVHQTGKQAKMLKEKPGGLEWLPAGRYGFMNMGQGQQGFVLVEFK